MTANFMSLRSRFTAIQGVEKKETARSICIPGAASTPRADYSGWKVEGDELLGFVRPSFPLGVNASLSQHREDTEDCCGFYGTVRTDHLSFGSIKQNSTADENFSCFVARPFPTP
jgi:hypothetical protein